jgi:hypothetical protein
LFVLVIGQQAHRAGRGSDFAAICLLKHLLPQVFITYLRTIFAAKN